MCDKPPCNMPLGKEVVFQPPKQPIEDIATSLNTDEEYAQNSGDGAETWFKFLALFTCFCACFIYSILIWFLVCRENRLTLTDQETKELAFRKEMAKIEKEKERKIRMNCLKNRLKYILTAAPRITIERTEHSVESKQQPELYEEPVKPKKSKHKKRRKDNKNANNSKFDVTTQDSYSISDVTMTETVDVTTANIQFSTSSSSVSSSSSSSSSDTSDTNSTTSTLSHTDSES